MASQLDVFERIARLAYAFTDPRGREEASLHPFEMRNIHAAFPKKVRQLFDDGHFAEATFAAFKHIDKFVRQLSKSRKTGEALMMQAFSETSPLLRLNALIDVNDIDEQRGYKFIFAGGQVAIRNPRAHDDVVDDAETCLDHLTFASLLIRRIDEAGLSASTGPNNVK